MKSIESLFFFKFVTFPLKNIKNGGQKKKNWQSRRVQVTVVHFIRAVAKSSMDSAD